MKNFWKILLGSFIGCILALLIFGFIFAGIVGSIASFAESSQPAMPKSAILKIDFSSPVSERSKENLSITTLSPEYSNTVAIYDAIRGINIAATDPSIKFIYLNTDRLTNSETSVSTLEELRKALLHFRESGKAVIAYGNQFSSGSYYIASVSDKIMMNAAGDSYISGVGVNILFFKDLLDKLGVEMQLIRHGKYKSAGEQFTKNGMSPENREQNQEMVNSIWGSMTKEIAESRDFTEDELNKWIDNLELVSPEEMLDRKMIDKICHLDEVKSYLAELFNVKDSDNLAFISLDKYVKNKVTTNLRAKDKIAIVYVDGELVVSGDDSNAGGIQIASELAKVNKDSTVKAVVLRVNSPGGTVQAAEMIKREVELLQKNKLVVASFGSYAASGGYWISAGADKIYSDNTTLTGSIGCFAMIPNVGSALQKSLKINNESVSSNKHGNMFSGMDQLDSEEKLYIESLIERIYTRFTSLVAEGRNMSVAQVDEIGQGRVWTGSDAVKIGLVDEIGGIADAIQYAASASGLESYRVIEVPHRMTLYEKLLKTVSEAKVAAGNYSNPLNAIENAYSSLKNETNAVYYARTPYIYEIR